MNISLNQPFSISESPTGIKNTEIIYPRTQSVSSRNRLFISCNGNSNQALIAGQAVCDAIEGYFHSFLDKGNDITPVFIEKSIRFAEIALDELKKNYRTSPDLSTTLSMLFFAPGSVYFCQIGNSHIYQIRDNQVIYKSIESSFDRKIIGSKKPVEVNIVILKDIKPDDYFFIYAGEFNEAQNEEIVLPILATEAESTEDKLNKIKKLYLARSGNAFSAHLIPIRDIEDSSSYLKRKMNSLVHSFI